MDRLSWYQPGESMEEIIIQAGHVGIFDGDLKQSAFELGTASLTLQRIIWADSSDPDCRLVLNHSLVDRIERHSKSVFGKGGKIIVTLKVVPSGCLPGPVASSGFNSLRLVFKQGGQDDFYKKYSDALQRQTWKRTSSSSSSAGSRSCTLYAGSAAAQSSQRSLTGGGLEKRFTEQNSRLNQTISQAFEDMSRLMEEAREMVNLSKSITERLRVSEADMSEEETLIFKRNLLNLGVSDPVMKSAIGFSALVHESIAGQLHDLLFDIVTKHNGSISLPEAFCKVNRSLENDLVSPEDLLNACLSFDSVSDKLRLTQSPEGTWLVELVPGRASACPDPPSPVCT